MSDELKRNLNSFAEYLAREIKAIAQTAEEAERQSRLRGGATAPDAAVQEYLLTVNERNAKILNPTFPDAPNRYKMQTWGKYGKIHLDFTYLGNNANGGLLFTLPSNAPLPIGLVEVQTHDGGSIYLDNKSKLVKAGVLTKNTRYIVDLIGFFG